MFRILALFTTLAGSFVLSFAQSFTIPSPGAEWNNSEISIDSYFPSVATSRLEPIGDTVINSQVYSKMIRTWSINYRRNDLQCEYSSISTPKNENRYVGAVRSRNDSVWFFGEMDSTERLLYDFNGNPGDSIGLDGIDGRYYAYIGTKDSVLIGNSYRKRLGLIGYNALYDTWIEGIGSTFGFFATYHRHWEFTDYELTCYKEQGVALYIAEPYCPRCNIATHTADQDIESAISTFPNPVVGDLNISISPELQPVCLNIYNLCGSIVFSMEINSTGPFVISKSELAQGSLVLEIACSDNFSIRKLILVL